MRQPNGSVFCRGEHSVNHVMSRKSMQFHGKNYRESLHNMDSSSTDLHYAVFQLVPKCFTQHEFYYRSFRQNDIFMFLKISLYIDLHNKIFFWSQNECCVRTFCTSLLPSTHFIFFKPHFLTPFTLPHPFRSNCET